MNEKAKQEIVCIGEVLWDALPEGLFLGGAPFNVACHLHMLGESVAFVSRVGDDQLGREAVRRVADRGLSTELIQTDKELPTGFVTVTLNAEGVPDYVIEDPVAWDAVALTPVLEARVAQAKALVFGSLAQRHAGTQRSIQALSRSARLIVFDVNLRPPFIDLEVLEASLHAADVVKVSEEELIFLARQWGFSTDLPSAAAALGIRFGNRVVCVSRGADGSALWREGSWLTRPGYRVTVKDTVGAGDAFLAAFLHGLLAGYSAEDLLDFANRLGAYVASQSGATPKVMLK